MDPSRNSLEYDYERAYITGLAQDGFFIKIYSQIPSGSVISGRELMSRIEQIAGHLRRVKSCEAISRDQLAFGRVGDSFFRVQALMDSTEDGRVRVKYIDYGHEDWVLVSDVIVVESSLADILTTCRPLAEEFYLDGVSLLRPLLTEESVALREKVVYQTLPCRLRRPHPELPLIEIAIPGPSGENQSLAKSIIESGYAKKCSTEDIAKFLGIKLPTRVEEVVMQPSHQYGGMPAAQFTMPPPGLTIQPQPNLNTVQMMQQAKTSVNSRLVRYTNKTDAAVAAVGSGGTIPVMIARPSVACPPPLADRKQYNVSDVHSSCTLAQPLPVKSTHNVYVSHVEDGPYNFCLQLKSSVEEVLPKLRSVLARYQVAAPMNAKLIPGSLVMAKGSDDTLRRAVIMKIQQDKCNVYYIDYGNGEERPYSEIFQLPNTAAVLSPAMAMQFSLADIDSVKITDANKEYFSRLLLGKLVLIRVTESNQTALQHCELMWDGRSMREILINLNAPMQYHYHTAPSGDDNVVSVVYAEGPNQFYVQYKSEMDTIYTIEEAVAQYCSGQPTLSDISSIHIGMPVGAIFPDDSKWYRALVMGLNGNKINVFYVDYGNRAEVPIQKLCLLSRELVTKWNTQAIQCCLIGFDTVSPALYLVDKMEETVLGKTYKLKLHSILSGFRLNVDLIDDQGNSIAEKMKCLVSEKKKSTSTETHAQPKPLMEKKVPAPPYQDDDRTSQHSSDSGGGKKNKFQRPPLKADRERGERGNKFEQRSDRNKFEEKPNSFAQHDDRVENNYKQKVDSRSDWKKGAKKPYMDEAEQWSSKDTPPSFDKTDTSGDKTGDTGGLKKNDWRNTPSGDKPGWGGDNRGGRSERNDKGGSWNNNRFERKPLPSGTDDENKNGDWGSKDRKSGSTKFGDRENKYGDREGKVGDRGNKFGDRDNKFGDRGSRFGDGESRFGDKGNKFGDRDNRFGDKGNKFGDHDKKPRGRENGIYVERSKGSAGAKDEVWEGVPVAEKRPSVVISEYPHQPIVAGKEYKVFFAGMDAPNDVYVHLADCDPVLDKIRAMIDADKTASSRPVSKPVLAMPVLARFKDDGLLYRALIKSLTKSDKGKVDVLFVDFGNSSVVSSSEVFPISAELMGIPIQAIHVIITDMTPLPNADFNACQSHFMGGGLTLKPSSTVAINMVQCVQGTLVLPSGKSIADAIKNDPLCNGAKSSTPGPAHAASAPSASGEPKPTPEPTSVTWVERLDLLVGQTISAKIVKKLGTDLYSLRATACLGLVAPAHSEDALSTDLTVGEEVIVNVTALSRDKLLVKYFDKNGKSLSGGSSISPVCPLPIIKRKNKFMISHTEQEFVYIQRDDSGTQLVDLLNDMFTYYEANGDVPKDKLKVGDLCVAQSLLDDNWYRARIEAVDDTYSVRYVDYGNTEEVTLDKTKILDAKFTTPELCVRVALPVEYNSLEECFDSLDSLGEAAVECTFIKKDTERDCWLVDLSAVGAKDNFALQWIKENKAKGISSVPADPRLREPGWDLKKGDSIPIVVTHVDSPDVFWVHLSDHLTDIDALQSKLQQLPEGDETELGDMFVAKYTDDCNWYRAIHCGDDVRFIDYGNTDPAHERKKLPEELIHPIKGYAVPLRLCVKPAGAEWTAEAKEAFDAFIEREEGSPDEFKKAEIVSVDFEIVVDLKCGNDLLSSILISGGHAAPFESKDGNFEANVAEKKVLKDSVPKAVEKLGAELVEDEIPKDTVSGCVTTAISINDFYFQLDLKSDSIEQLTERLSGAGAFEVVEDPSIGDYVIAKFPEDSAWYRAKVLSKEPLEVLFMDYGDISPTTEFRKLPLDLATIPLMAWHCSAEIDDAGVDEKFLNLVSEGATFAVTFTGIKDGKHIVQVSVDGENISAMKSENDSITDTSAKSPAKAESPAQADSPPKAGSPTQADSSAIAESPVKVDSPAKAASPAKNQPSVIDEAPAKDETKDSEKSVPMPPLLGKPLYKDCILVHSNGPYDFYVQTDDDHIQVEEMANALFAAGNFPKLGSVKKGDFVVAQYPEDDAYYRAVVIEDDPPVVHFTDYGNSCPATCFHEMPAELRKVAQLAVRCSLQSPPGGWSAYAIDQFTTLLTTDTKAIDLKILSRGDPNIVDVEISGSSLTQKLAPDVKFVPDSVQDIPQTDENPSEKDDQSTKSKDSKNGEFPVTISFANSPSEFYYQKDEAKVSHLATRLKTAEEFKPIEKCEVGLLICAKYSEDSLWYRAKVISTDPVEVLFIDYGNVSEVQELRELPDDLFVIPPLAVKASLRPQDHPWTTEETDKFLDVVYADEMKCSIIEETSDLTIVRLNHQNGDMITYLGRSP